MKDGHDSNCFFQWTLRAFGWKCLLAESFLSDSVCAQTESAMYTDQFFEGNDVIVNALDNLEARRYMDR